jgi:outer membrane immunogenic protein
MKRIFISAVLSLVGAANALAADLPQAPPPQAPVAYVPTMAPVYNWGGIYFGVNGGYELGGSQWSGPAIPPDFSVNGGLVGGTVGVNYQIEQFVLGVEADFDWQGLTGTSSNGFCFLNGAQCQTKSDWLGTFRGRLGYASDKVLFYGTAGGAVGNVQAGLVSGSSTNTTALGWTAGAGTEVAFTDNFTGRIEYLYVDLTNVSCGAASCGAPISFSGVNLTENVIRVGFDYKFRP